MKSFTRIYRIRNDEEANSQPHTGRARNFDWEGPKMEKSCDVSW